MRPALDLTHQDSSRADFIALPRETPGEIIVAWNKRDPHYFDPYRIDIATGAGGDDRARTRATWTPGTRIRTGGCWRRRRC